MLLFLLWLLGGPVAALFGTLFPRSDCRPHRGPGLPASRAGAGIRQALIAGIRTGVALTLAVLGVDLRCCRWTSHGRAGGTPTLLANGWLLGREYFELAALRHLPPDQVQALRRRYRGRITAGGLLIALASMVPGVNLVAPLFGTAMMVHLFKRIQHGTSV